MQSVKPRRLYIWPSTPQDKDYIYAVLIISYYNITIYHCQVKNDIFTDNIYIITIYYKIVWILPLFTHNKCEDTSTY